MDGQAVLKLARLLRLGPGVHAPEIHRIMAGLTPAERPQVQRAAKAINLMPSLVAGDPAPGTIRGTMLDAGWSWSQEGSSPSGSALGWGRGRIRIDSPGEEPRWRTIKIQFTPDMTWEDFWAKVQDIIDGWNTKYPDSQIELDMDSFIWF